MGVTTNYEVRFYDLEEAAGVFCQAVQDTERDLLVESHLAACAVESGKTWNPPLSKEQILAYLGNQADRARATMNNRYKVGVVFPPETWLADSPLKWTHYKLCAELADLDDPATWDDARAMLVKAADAGWKTRHLQAVIEQRKDELERQDARPVLSEPRLVVDAMEGIYRGVRENVMIIEPRDQSKLHALHIGQRLIVSIMVLEDDDEF